MTAIEGVRSEDAADVEDATQAERGHHKSGLAFVFASLD